MIGQQISHYKILEKLGEGGMGVVYKAQDMKLDRIVALKFLPHHLISSEAEQARFLQEAKAASALNHPNVCTIHDIKEEKEERFIVMEFVDGVTLRKKFEASPLKVYEAVSYAIQISEALKEAHSRGVVHRDIKSDNVMINSKNQVKVMDFGLAKLKGSLKLTRTSSTVGTLGYMAPEQIQGAEADARSDIFSFGVLLFEILTGRLPFRGEHEAAMVYSIVNEEPESLNKYRGDVPNDLQHIILRCLEKDPEDRYQHAEEIVRELRRIQKQSSHALKTMKAGHEVPIFGENEAAPSQPSLQRTKPAWIILAALIVFALVGAIVLLVLKKEPAETISAEVKITKFTSLPGLEDEPTWSPDGKFLAYTTDDRGNFDILVQPLGGGQLIRVADSDADDAQPAWSPDGSKLAFVSARDQGGRFSSLFGQGILETYLKGKGGDIFLVPALGGRPVKLVSNGFDPAWSPDGKTIVYRSIQGDQWDLWTVPAEGGTPKQLTNDIDMDYQPSFSSDGKWILCGSGGVGRHEVRVISVSGGTPKILTNDTAMVVKPVWSPDGQYILFSSTRKGSMNLWKMAFKPHAIEFVTPVRITVGEGDDVNISAASTGSTIAFATVKTSPDIWELTVQSSKLRQVSFETGLENQPRLSPDGKMLLVLSNRGGTDQLWTMDLYGKFLSQLTSENNVAFGSLSPDGKEILYHRNEQGKPQVVVRSLGEISPKKVIDNAGLPFWSPDGKKLVFLRLNAATKAKEDVWTHTLDSGEEKQLTSLEWSSIFPAWSPDGNWIAFNVNKKNTREIWIIPSSGGTPRQVLTDEAEYSHPIWSPRDKDLVLCLRDHKDICLVSVSTGKVKELYKFTESSVNLIDYPTWSPDGQKVYFSRFRKSGDIYILENY